ncbi:MAG: alpha/beta fold hydrolase [Myxococcota bacterium]
MSTLNPEPDVALEVRTFVGGSAMPVVVVKGLGGSAASDRLVQEMAAHFTVITMSPRNSGESTGSLTLDNLIHDVRFVVEHAAQEHGAVPGVVAHSMGAYAVARLLEHAPVTPRAALLAPLLDITEQNPDVMNWYFRRSLAKNRVPGAVRIISSFYTAFIAPPSEQARPTGMSLSQQRFDHGDVLPFLHSIFNAPRITRPLQTPTLILVAGRSNAGLRIRNLDQLASTWRSLQATGSELEVLPELDHFLSQGGEFFSSSRTPELVARMAAFLRGASPQQSAA